MGEENDNVSFEKKSNYPKSALCDVHEYNQPLASSPVGLCRNSEILTDDEKDQELTYGPGIVNKLKSRFLSITLRESQTPRPKLRRYSSLENLLEKDGVSCSNDFLSKESPAESKDRVNGDRLQVKNLKRAKSVETLLLDCDHSTGFTEKLLPEFIPVNGPLPSSCFTTENHLNKGVSAVEIAKGNVIKRRNVNHQTNITDEEFPKPDIVKTYKRIFEPAEPKSAAHSNIKRRPPVLRASAKSASTVNKPGYTQKNTNGSTVPDKQTNGVPAKNCAKEELKTNGEVSSDVDLCVNDEQTCQPLTNGEAHCDKNDASKNESNNSNTFNLENKNSQKLKSQIPNNNNNNKPNFIKNRTHSRNMYSISRKSESQLNSENAISPLPDIIAPLQKELSSPEMGLNVESNKGLDDDKSANSEEHSTKEIINQASRNGHTVSDINGMDDSNNLEHKEQILSEPMFESNENKEQTEAEVEVLKPSTLLGNKKPLWQKPPSSTNTVVFDFRGKDVKPHISLNPAPFGCRPARVSNKKRHIGGPLVDGKEGIPSATNGFVFDDEPGESTDYDMDEADISMSLPHPSGIVFEGENIKIGRGSLLTTRNKKLKIQFDDSLTSTFEYPSELSILEDQESPPSSLSDSSDCGDSVPSLDNKDELLVKSLKSKPVLGSTGGLSTYTPSVLITAESFQLGMSRPVQRDNAEIPKEKKIDNENHEDMLKPANPEEISSWSVSTTTSDLLF